MLCFREDNNVVELDPSGSVVLHETGTSGTPAGVLVFQPDGNLVLYPKKQVYVLGVEQWANTWDGVGGKFGAFPATPQLGTGNPTKL